MHNCLQGMFTPSGHKHSLVEPFFKEMRSFLWALNLWVKHRVMHKHKIKETRAGAVKMAMPMGWVRNVFNTGRNESAYTWKGIGVIGAGWVVEKATIVGGVGAKVVVVEWWALLGLWVVQNVVDKVVVVDDGTGLGVVDAVLVCWHLIKSFLHFNASVLCTSQIRLAS